MQTSIFLRVWMLKKGLKESRGNSHAPTHPPLHCNEEEFEIFGVWNKEVQALNIKEFLCYNKGTPDGPIVGLNQKILKKL